MMTDFISSDKFELKPNIDIQDKKDCKGKIFRCKVNEFISNIGAYVYGFRMVPQKRKSCPGCRYCDWLMDELQEYIYDTQNYNPAIDKIVDNALYKLKWVPEASNEDGYVECWDFEFVKIEEEIQG